MMHKAWRSIEEVPYCFSRSLIKFHGHTGGKIDDFLIQFEITWPVAAIKSLRFALFDYVHIIVSSWNFQELLPMTKSTSMQKVKVRGQRSRSQRSTPNLAVSGPYLQFEFRYDDEMMHRAWWCPIFFQGHLSNFKVTWLKKVSIFTQIGHFRTVTPVWIHQWLWNDAQSLK